MPPTDARPEPPQVAGAVRGLLAAATAVSFLLVVQNFALDILPDRTIPIAPAEIRPYPGAKTFAYVFDFDGSEPDRWPSVRSRVRLFEDGRAFPERLRRPDEALVVGGGLFAHEPGRIVFATFFNSDPRTDGHRYVLTTPVLYQEWIGDAAMLAFLGCAGAWYLVARRGGRPAAAGDGPASRWRWHLAGAGALFLLGLYCNTGTLTPYAITTHPVVAPSTGYAYNPDHEHFRVLFDFVDGRGRQVWDRAILLRRILFPVLGWPLMKLLGFEIGGTLASLGVNTAALLTALVLLRRRIGERGAVLAGWLLALYPGAAYWAGLPYTYCLIFPASLLLMVGLMRLAEPATPLALAATSLAMGVAYLGYDLAITFVPASLLVLCWRRRFAAAASSAALQLAPLGAWILALSRVFHQPLRNGNSGIYMSVLQSVLQAPDLAAWGRQIAHAAGVGCDIFLGSNFIFLPALFLVVLALNATTSRIRFHMAEIALLASGLAFFAVLNLAPGDSGTWEMRGNWISRLYQPVFPALLVFIARWWQALPPLSGGLRAVAAAAIAAATLGDGLIVFGPILGNPAHISEDAFYRFYDHTDAHFFYEANLRELGRRPLGFPRRIAMPTAAEVIGQREQELANAVSALSAVRAALEQNRDSLAAVLRDFRSVGLADAQARADLFNRRLERRAARGEITADEARRERRKPEDFMGAPLREAMGGSAQGPEIRGKGAAPVPKELSEVQAAILAESARLRDVQRAITGTQDDLKAAVADLGQAREELARLDKEGDGPARR